MERFNRKPEGGVLELPALVAPGLEVAEHLKVNITDPVFKRYRLQLADKLPYRLIESYYPSDLFGELLTTDIGSKPLFLWLQERHGLTAVHAKEVLKARPANIYERSKLRISPGAPVVDIERTVLADKDRVIEMGENYSFSSALYFYVRV